jgi:hypothetical protein
MQAGMASGGNREMLKKEMVGRVEEKEMKDEERNMLQQEIQRVLEEHDSLLQFLIIKKSHTNDERKSSTTSAENVLTSPTNNSSSDSLYKSGAKLGKDDKMKIEELQTVNEKLRQLVYQLLGECEKTHKENVMLKKENDRLKNEKENYSSSLPELPPLEHPTLLY